MTHMFFKFDYSSSIFIQSSCKFCSQKGPNMNPWQVLLREAYNECAQVSAHVWEIVLACENDNKREREGCECLWERERGERERDKESQFGKNFFDIQVESCAKHWVCAHGTAWSSSSSSSSSFLIELTFWLDDERKIPRLLQVVVVLPCLSLSLIFSLMCLRKEKGINVTQYQTTTIAFKNYEWTNEC